MTSARPGDFIKNTHQRVQVHMGVDEIWRVISGRLSEEENLCTVVVRAVGIDWGDLSDRGIEGRCQSRLVGHLSETLEWSQRLASVRWIGSPGPTFTAASHSARSASDRLLHSRRTRGFAQWVAYAVATNVRRRAKDMCFARPVVISSGWQWCVGDGGLEKGQGDELEPNVITRDGCMATRSLCW